MNYEGMREEILEVFADAARLPAKPFRGRRLLWIPGERQRLQNSTGQRERSADRRLHRAVRRAMDAKMARGRPGIEMSVCPHCGLTIEHREGSGRWQHVGATHCPSGIRGIETLGCANPRREMGVSLLREGHSMRAVARMLKVAPRTVMRWRDRSIATTASAD